MSILPPELDTNYELLEEMHEGGMGAVFKARHRHLDELCVIKVMHPRLNDIAGARDRFFREAKRGKQLRHPNIAEVQAFFVATDGKAYLVMEYVDGENLRDLLIRQGPVDPTLLITIGLQALSALAYLHSHQLIHRDISPDNLMLTRDNSGAPHLKLIDLGIAKAIDETMSLTGTGSFIGKVYYASPEQFRQNVDARSDLYSLGVVMYELATGARPIRETDTMAIIAASLREDPPLPFSETDPRGRVQPALRAVILKALEKKPANRYQTASEFAHALQNATAADGTTVVGPDTALPTKPDMPAPAPPTKPEVPIPAPPTVREPVRALPRAMLVAGALIVLLSAFGAFQMLRHEETAQTTATISQAPPGTSVTVMAPQSVTQRSSLPSPELMRKQPAADPITRGKHLVGKEKMEDAYAAFKEATQSDPDNAFAWANFGGAAAVLGRKDEARAAYERALTIDSSNWLANYNFACLLTDDGERVDALRHLELAVRQLRSQTTSREELAAVLSSIRRDEALRALRDDSAFSKLLSAD